MKYILTILSTFVFNIFAVPKLAMYWQINPSPFSLNMVPNWVDTVIIAFSTIKSDSSLDFPQNDLIMKTNIEFLQNRNQTVLLSIGGAANCGPLGIRQDNMFGIANFNSQIWVNSVKNLINYYGFNGVDIDYECRYNIIQNPNNIASALNDLRTILPNITISFVAFSVVNKPSNWQNYKLAFLNITRYVDEYFWASYNVDLDQNKALNWYLSANITDISNISNICLSSVYYGYCLGNGCVYGPGPSEQQIITWAKSVKQYGGGGLFLWDITGELQILNNDYNLFNTASLSKQIADILHN